MSHRFQWGRRAIWWILIPDSMNSGNKTVKCHYRTKRWTCLSLRIIYRITFIYIHIYILLHRSSSVSWMKRKIQKMVQNLIACNSFTLTLSRKTKNWDEIHGLTQIQILCLKHLSLQLKEEQLKNVKLWSTLLILNWFWNVTELIASPFFFCAKAISHFIAMWFFFNFFFHLLKSLRKTCFIREEVEKQNALLQICHVNLAYYWICTSICYSYDGVKRGNGFIFSWICRVRINLLKCVMIFW